MWATYLTMTLWCKIWGRKCYLASKGENLWGPVQNPFHTCEIIQIKICLQNLSSYSINVVLIMLKNIIMQSSISRSNAHSIRRNLHYYVFSFIKQINLLRNFIILSSYDEYIFTFFNQFALFSFSNSGIKCSEYFYHSKHLSIKLITEFIADTTLDYFDQN